MSRLAIANGCAKKIGRGAFGALDPSYHQREGVREVTDKTICSIDGCGKRREKRDWCSAHYSRWRKLGDPLAGKPMRCPPGAKNEWLRSNANYLGEECLRWPFAYNPNGYGEAVMDGKITSANRAMCIEAHGPAPSEAHEAAHSCGNGKGGCLNPRHLGWSTSKENQADRIGHDTHIRGTRAPANKLTEAQVYEIRAEQGVKGRRIVAAIYGVSPQAISLIWSRKNWAWLKEKGDP